VKYTDPDGRETKHHHHHNNNNKHNYGGGGKGPIIIHSAKFVGPKAHKGGGGGHQVINYFYIPISDTQMDNYGYSGGNQYGYSGGNQYGHSDGNQYGHGGGGNFTGERHSLFRALLARTRNNRDQGNSGGSRGHSPWTHVDNHSKAGDLWKNGNRNGKITNITSDKKGVHYDVESKNPHTGKMETRHADVSPSGKKTYSPWTRVRKSHKQ
jgi:hypothetical protein